MVIVCAVLGLTYMGVLAARIIKYVMKEGDKVSITETMPARDSGLIGKRYLPHMKTIIVANIDGRAPFSAYSVDSNYEMTISEIGVTAAFTLKDSFRTKEKNDFQTNGVVYFPFTLRSQDYIKLRIRRPEPASRIWMTICGDSMSSQISDTLISYSLLCSSFAIRYNETGTIDIIGCGDNWHEKRPRPFPLDLILLKRDNHLYLLTLVPKESDRLIPMEVLDDIIHGE